MFKIIIIILSFNSLFDGSSTKGFFLKNLELNFIERL